MVSTVSFADDFTRALLALDRTSAKRILDDVASGGEVGILESLVVPALEDIGASWERGDVALSQVYMSGRICQDLMTPFLTTAGVARSEQPRIAVGVLDDTHVLGKQILTGVVRSAGYAIQDLGSRLTPEQLVASVRRDSIEVVMISVLMVRAALAVSEVVARLRDLGSDAIVVVGGAPFRFDRQLWREVGADHFGYNASDALGILAQIGGRS
jgi:trimethylamine corrinoid protein